MTQSRRDSRARPGLWAVATAGLTLLALTAPGAPAHATRAALASRPAAGGTTTLAASLTPQSLLAVEGGGPFQEGSQLFGGTGLFGASVAVSGDGRTAIVGAPLEGGGAGSARVFVLTPSGWQEQAELTPSETVEEAIPCEGEGEECRLGISVALSGNGDTALVGSPLEEGRSGAVRAFVRSGSSWSQLGPKVKPESPGKALFGRSVAISADGQTALIGAPGSASATVLRRSAGGWAQEGPTIAGPRKASSGRFGRTVALAGDGTVAFIGAPGLEGGAGAVWAFVREGENWQQEGPILTGPGEETAAGHFGSGLALSSDGSTALIGANGNAEGAGAAWALVRSGATWTEQGPELRAPEELGPAHFGQSVALSGSGDSALIGGPDDSKFAGAAWTFVRTASLWSAQAKIPAPQAPEATRFGTSVSLSGDGLTALIGAPYDLGLPGSAWALRTPGEPIVASVTPGEGPSGGGTGLTITGSGFLPGATVRIGSAASSVTVISETTITAVTAASPAGSYEVQVSDAGGSSTDGPSFTYTAAPSNTTTGETPTTTGETPPPTGGVLDERTAATPQPILAVRGNLAPVSGQVSLRLPGSHSFVSVTGLTEVPFGSIVDATNGSVSVTTADGHGGTQTIKFYQGEFGLTQGPNGQTVAKLMGGKESACPALRGHAHGATADAQAAAAKKVVRKLWASGHGKYSTQGHYAAGAVLGTQWLTEDLCGATLIRVATDAVAVTDLVKHRRVLVKAGHSYLARAR